jgi:hypothetical protein
VPEDLHPSLEKTWMRFCARNPVLSMGSDERMAAFRIHRRRLRDAGWQPLFEELRADLPEDSIHLEIGLDPDDDRLLRVEDAEFLRLMKGWPRSQGEYSLFARRVKYAGFITMVTKGALGQLPQMFTGETSDQSVDFDPADRHAVMRREPLV